MDKEKLSQELINLSKPQKNFTYPKFASFGPSHDPLGDLKYILRKAEPQGVHVEGHFKKSIEALFDELQIQPSDKVAVQCPAPREFLEVIARRAQVHFLSRDPEDLMKEDFSQIRLFLFSHPSGADGFYYPKDIYDRILQKALFNPRAVIYSDERQLLFSFNSVVPGSAESFLGTGRVYIGGSLYPIMCPQGPEISWWSSLRKKKIKDSLQDTESLLIAQQALYSFRSRQGRALQEFQRKLLVLQVSLRELADLLKPALLRGDIQVPYWPETGFHLLVSLKPYLRKRGLDLASFQARLLSQKGLYIESGEAYGVPESLLLCFAAKPSKLKELTAGFLESLT